MLREKSCLCLCRGLQMLTVAVVGGGILLSAEACAEAVDFSRDIQPLLAKRCFSCHGPDTHEGGLRLDQAAGATAELDSGGRAIVPGKTAESEILTRITSNDPDTQMPPEGPRLTAAQVDAITRWIESRDEPIRWQELRDDTDARLAQLVEAKLRGANGKASKRNGKPALTVARATPESKPSAPRRQRAAA